MLSMVIPRAAVAESKVLVSNVIKLATRDIEEENLFHLAACVQNVFIAGSEQTTRQLILLP